MNRFKWIVIGCLMILGILEALLFGYRYLQRTRRKRPPASHVYDVSAFRDENSVPVLFNEVHQFPVGLEKARGLSVGPRDRIYVVGDRHLVVFNAQGKEAARAELGAVPRCLAVSAVTNVYIGFRDHIEVYTAELNKAASWTSVGEGGLLTSIALARDSVFAADYGQRVVWRFDLKGRLRKALGRRDKTKGQLGFIVPSPFFDVAPGKESIWAVNPGRLRVEQYSYDGDLLKFWGKSSMKMEGFVGCCNPSHMVIRPDGSFVTSEKGIPRVKLYDAQGGFLGLVAGAAAFEESTTGLDLAVDSSGRVLVLDPSIKAVRVFVEKDGKDETGKGNNGRQT
jgi:hypothetical protein